jgi:hypothetical protein
VTRESPQHHCGIQKTEARASFVDPVIKGVEFNGNHFTVGLSDGHFVAIHLLLYPKLLDASELQRKSWKLMAGGKEIRWTDIGEDISVTRLLAFREVHYRADTLDA